VYTRPDYETAPMEENAKVKIFKNVPQMNISASYIRQFIKAGFSIRYLVPDAVFNAIPASTNFKNA
jgi:nicotinic acid mononucleotide adenylyltransferase